MAMRATSSRKSGILAVLSRLHGGALTSLLPATARPAGSTAELLATSSPQRQPHTTFLRGVHSSALWRRADTDEDHDASDEPEDIQPRVLAAALRQERAALNRQAYLERLQSKSPVTINEIALPGLLSTDTKK